tara:strand:+ start:6792 stop:7250 length:459 start_codon:yes stop_codon:yes gene_type:complete
MKKLKSFKELNNLYYKGELSDKQLNYNKNEYMQYEKDEFSPYQNMLYKRALYGLKQFTDEEIAKMHPKKKKRIRKVNIKAQKVLNLYKQAKVNSFLNNFFKFYFPNHRIGNFNTVDTNYICKTSFKELNITKKQVIDLFIKEGVLVNNFYKL